MEKAAAIILCIVPTVWEIINDRKGETKKDKKKDVLIAVVLYAVIALVNWWMFVTHPLKSLALTFAFRILVFDYAIQWILIRKGIIVGNWFTYTGETARWDRLISKINPWVRLAARLVIFIADLIWFLI